MGCHMWDLVHCLSPCSDECGSTCGGNSSCDFGGILLLRISEEGKLKGDAAIGLISTSAIAVGVTVTALCLVE